MIVSLRWLAMLGGVSLFGTGCGGLLGDDDCAAASCGDWDGGHGGSSGKAGKAGGSGVAGRAGAGRGGTGQETGGSSGVVGGGGGSTGGSAARGGTSPGGGGGSGTSGASATSGTGGTSGAAGEAGASSSPDDCQEPSDCELLAVDCCGSCMPTASDYVALNRASVDDYLATRLCTDRICPECAPIGAEWLTAICVTGRCEVLDARETELSACEMSADCRLRAGLGCCEDCGSTAAFVSLHVDSEAALTELVCDSEFACDACLPTPPEVLDATCVAGRCQTMPPTR